MAVETRKTHGHPGEMTYRADEWCYGLVYAIRVIYNEKGVQIKNRLNMFTLLVFLNEIGNGIVIDR